MAIVVLQGLGHGCAPRGGDVRIVREDADARDQLAVSLGVEGRGAGLARALDERVPLADHALAGRPPVRPGRLCVRRGPGRIVLHCRAARPGMGLVVRRRDGVDVPARRYGLGGPALLRALAPALLRLLPDPVHPPHGGGAAMAARAAVEHLELVEAAPPDAGTLGEQGGIGLRPGAEGSRLLQQRPVAVEGLPVGIAHRALQRVVELRRRPDRAPERIGEGSRALQGLLLQAQIGRHLLRRRIEDRRRARLLQRLAHLQNALRRRLRAASGRRRGRRRRLARFLLPVAIEMPAER